MSIVLDILKQLNGTGLSYKGVRVNIFGIPQSDNIQRSSFGNTMARLNKRGLIEKNNNNWSVTNKGKIYLKNKSVFKKFDSPFDKKSPRDLLLMFDIPETKKLHRSWLRWQLKEFNYVMVQRSVWVGPSPLPKNFKEYLKEVEIQDCIKIFKLAKNYQLD